MCQPPKLPSCNTEPDDSTSATIYGWGRADEYGQYADNLKKAEVFIRSRSTCNTLPLGNKDEPTANAK